ncbi:putative AbiEii toxin of type IV toxin-antitoxin system [Chitinophaga dinghuensis]|uniref:Putative AbiEii toxin of type IV toxin-antitoxin system n=1 Tax=Chitinophaga dinghuensis TaxID=1539050 RepID=A0A327VT91_9BACT|nr:AAA family ATPase [Chitinophaga dinghuensis]RAJ77250.1 putative AbiEii toxin of type IV toxin-antitoxin system [Chitinophaga dinghuensis]
MATFTFNIQTATNQNIPINIGTGQLLFVIGRNGAGKSALVNHIFRQNIKNSYIVLAHRPIWMESNSAVISVGERKITEERIKKQVSDTGRTYSFEYYERRRLALDNLVQMQNGIDRALAEAYRSGDMTKAELLKQKVSPLQMINEIFKKMCLNISIVMNELQEFFALGKDGSKYSIVDLSDGEKNAFMLCAEILTAKTNTLFILDEPERHLHPALMGPLINSIVESRPDCSFVIATHDLSLPETNVNSAVILLRNVTKKGGKFFWTFDQISGSGIMNEIIPEDMKRAILGARRKVLFVEGAPTSRDMDLYQLLFPETTVECKESCVKVERAVEGVRGNPIMNWVEAFGIIDADDRTTDQIKKMEAKGVYALPAYSIEYLYYNPDTVRAAAEHYADFVGRKAIDIFSASQEKIIANMEPHKRRLCSRVCENRIKEEITRGLPTWRQISEGLDSKELFKNIDEKASKYLSAEVAKFDKMVAASDINGLLTLYPFRETQVISGIVAAFGISASSYEGIVRKMVLDGKPIKNTLLAKLGNIVTAINSATPAVRPVLVTATS